MLWSYSRTFAWISHTLSALTGFAVIQLNHNNQTFAYQMSVPGYFRLTSHYWGHEWERNHWYWEPFTWCILLLVILLIYRLIGFSWCRSHVGWPYISFSQTHPGLNWLKCLDLGFSSLSAVSLQSSYVNFMCICIWLFSVDPAFWHTLIGRLCTMPACYLSNYFLVITLVSMYE